MTKFILFLIAFISSNLLFAKECVRYSFDGLTSAKLYENVDAVDTPFGKGVFVNEYNSKLIWRESPIIAESWGVSAWVAPRMYAGNTGAIANSIDSERGWILGIRKDGTIEFSYTINGSPTKQLITSKKIPLLKWSHIGASFDGEFVRIFINGKESAKKKARGTFDFSNAPVEIGRTQIPLSVKTSAGIAKHASLKSYFRFDGIIADLRISDLNFFQSILENVKKSENINKDSGLKFPKLPCANLPCAKFGAYHSTLKFEPTWDNLWRVAEHSDVVVRFPDKPIKYIFWRGMGYVPVWASENDIWLTDQSLENFRNGECSEVMSDKQCRYSHIRVVENGEARVLIHWRYAMTNVLNQIRDEDETGWGEWVDEYFVIYPDGIGVRKQILHSSNYEKRKQWGYQFQETILINQPGTRPTDNLEKYAMTFSDMQGNTASYSWLDGSPNFDKPDVMPIQIVNIKSKYKPFSIFEPTRTTRSFLLHGLWTKQTPYHCRNHYPVTQFKNDGQRYVPDVDRPTHTSLAETVGAKQKYEKIGKNSYAVRQMFGMTDSKIDTLLPLAKSWNFPAKASTNNDAFTQPKYDVYQRAYLISKNKKDVSVLEINFDASKDSPIYNLAVIVENWDVENPSISVNGKQLIRGKDFFFSRFDELSNSKFVLFVNCKTDSKVNLKIEK